jgi:hypothetical protein
MNKKVIGIFVCMLLIVTAISATGAANIQTLRNVLENIDLERNPIKYPSSPVDSNGDIAIAIVAEVTVVDDTYNLLGGAISVGDKIKGKYIYDSTTPDSLPGYPSLGMYEHFTSPYGIELMCGGLVFKTDPNNVHFTINIFNNFYYYGDAYAPFSANNLDLSNGNKVDFIGWGLIDSTGTALSSDALPTTAPVLSDWTDNYILIDGYEPSSYNYYSIEATVTKASLSRSKTRDSDFPMQPIFIWLFEQFPNMFPILRQILDIN